MSISDEIPYKAYYDAVGLIIDQFRKDA